MNIIGVFLLMQAILVPAPGGSWQYEFKTIAGPYYNAEGLVTCQSHANFFYAVSNTAPAGTSANPLIGCFQIQ